MAMIYISLGSNIHAKKNILSGLEALSEEFLELKLSQVYESESVGFSGDNFINLVAQAQTDLSVEEVTHVLKQIEKEQGRIKNIEKFSDRTLDLDLLLYDDLICSSPVELPRDEIHKNAFVLKPLVDLIPEQKHPLLLKTYSQLWKSFTADQKLWVVDLYKA